MRSRPVVRAYGMHFAGGDVFVQNQFRPAEAREMDSFASNPQTQPLTQGQFMRLLLAADRELLRHVMALVPNVSDARDVAQGGAIALWRAVGKYDLAKPFVPWACRFVLNEA